ncbi:unnamed protein product [Arabidopsis halleri]
MESKTMKIMFFLMVFVFAMTWSPSSAQPTDPEGCFKAFKSTSRGCLESIKGILHGHIHGIKKECCETVSIVSDMCWPIIFPSMPYIRFALKGICTIKYSLH